MILACSVRSNAFNCEQKKGQTKELIKDLRSTKWRDHHHTDAELVLTSATLLRCSWASLRSLSLSVSPWGELGLSAAPEFVFCSGSSKKKHTVIKLFLESPGFLMSYNVDSALCRCWIKWSWNIYFDGSPGLRCSWVSSRPEDVSQHLPGKKKGKSEMDSFRCSMHKKPKILTGVGVWGFSASRPLLFGGSSQPLTPDTNKILTKVLVFYFLGDVKVGFFFWLTELFVPLCKFFHWR